MVSELEERSRSDLPIPPGELLAEELDAIGMTQSELAARTGRPVQVINEIVRGKKQITHDTAIELEKVLGIPADVWINLESNFRLTLARNREEERLEEQKDWLTEFPVREMEEQGWIAKCHDPKETVAEILRFLGVASFTAWQESVVGLRVTPKANVSWPSLAVWLRRGEIDGNELPTEPYSESRFRETLRTIRQLTRERPEEFSPRLANLCSTSGVAVVFTKELPKSGAHGATRWLTPDKALIQLSLRYKTNDHFWFSFYHESCHILRHKVKDVHVDGIDTNGTEEAEANEFAEDLLVPRADWDEFVADGIFNRSSIEGFAESVGIAPGIIVGRLQNKGIVAWNSTLNSLKVRFRWVDAIDN